MCGIAGYIGNLDASSVLLVALERLKYRGYDSAGIVTQDNGELHLRKSAGRLKELQDLYEEQDGNGHCGIAHTRWATHGSPTSENAHPHCDSEERIAVVHNGIIENHEQLRRELSDQGAIFQSQTDSEVIPHLLAQLYDGDPIAAIQACVKKLEGSYAFAVIFADIADHIYVARQGSPLLIGRGKQAQMIASDVPALLPHAQEVCYLQDGEIATINRNTTAISDLDGNAIEAEFKRIEINFDAVSKGDYDSYMAKEIAEQPEIIQRLIDDRVNNGILSTAQCDVDLSKIQHVVFLACGTSWHAALLGKRYLEHFARIHVEVDISSEYRYRNPIASGDTLVVAISQSGETADTLASLRLARSMFIPVISLVNVANSTIARESDGVLPLLCGPEIGVASTKAYTAQLTALYLFALQIAIAKGRLNEATAQDALRSLLPIPELVASTLKNSESHVVDAVDVLAAANATVFLGRGGEHPTALEGALKLKEIAYVHATGYPAGEFKHGPIALVTNQLPVVCITPQDAMHEKMLSNLQEVRAREGRIISVGQANDKALRKLSDHLFPVEQAGIDLLQPMLSILPLQRYAYHVAQARGCDVDQPRNLAKSVTVE